MSSARRAALAALFWASWAAASRSALAIACILNSSTAPAISPSSSRRPRPGSTTSKLPPASSRIALHIAIIGREMPLPSTSASAAPSRKPPAASITIRRSVSPMVASDSASSRCWSDRQVRLHRAGALDDRARRIRHLGDQLVDLLRILDQLGQRLPVFVRAGRRPLSGPARSFRPSTRSRAASFRRISGAPSRWSATVWSELMTKVLASAVTAWN